MVIIESPVKRRSKLVPVLLLTLTLANAVLFVVYR